jgi:hypothetical protein
MRLEPSGSYETFERINLAGGTAIASISREVEDSCWDGFLQDPTGAIPTVHNLGASKGYGRLEGRASGADSG